MSTMNVQVNLKTVTGESTSKFEMSVLGAVETNASFKCFRISFLPSVSV